MLGAYLSPLAPAAVLLLGAFILPIVMPRLPEQPLRSWIAPVWTGLAFLALLGIRLTLANDNPGEGLELLSGWNFVTPDSVAALIIRADNLSLPFLLVTLLALLAVILLRAVPPVLPSTPPVPEPEAPEQSREPQIFSFVAHLPWSEPGYWLQVAGWWAMAAAACLLFISANSLTLAYAIVAFDLCTAFYWIGRNNRDVGVARLFLGIFTAISAVVVNLTMANGGMFLFGLALWLRLGLYPLVETQAQRHWLNDERLIYRCLTLAVGIYLAARVIDRPLPIFIQILALLLMLLSGLLAWLAGPGAANEPVPDAPATGVNGTRLTLLNWLILTESLVILLIGPLSVGLAAVFVLALVLSLVALWTTPALGKPRFAEGAWSWPYLPALLATLTLLGFPLLLGWPMWAAIYNSLLSSSSGLFILVIVLAESLALSSLVSYWAILSQGNELNFRRSAAGILAMVPFLTPGLGPFILSAMINIESSVTGVTSGVVGLIISLGLAAITLGYFRNWLINRLQLPPQILGPGAGIAWIFRQGETILDALGRFVLRIRVILDGQHYLGWAIFVALVGALVIIFS